jgi:hypothetical protein
MGTAHRRRMLNSRNGRTSQAGHVVLTNQADTAGLILTRMFAEFDRCGSVCGVDVEVNMQRH